MSIYQVVSWQLRTSLKRFILAPLYLQSSDILSWPYFSELSGIPGDKRTGEGTLTGTGDGHHGVLSADTVRSTPTSAHRSNISMDSITDLPSAQGSTILVAVDRFPFCAFVKTVFCLSVGSLKRPSSQHILLRAVAIPITYIRFLSNFLRMFTRITGLNCYLGQNWPMTTLPEVILQDYV